MTNDIEKLYDAAAERWVRRSPESLSDFTARPIVFDRLRSICEGTRVVDLGCGEGYCARALAEMGAAHIFGLDTSSEMIGRAQQAEEQDCYGCLEYHTGTVTQLPLSDNSVDIALGVFVYNYLSIGEMRQSMLEAHRVLVDSGTFLFTVPHPALPFMRPNEHPFFFDQEAFDYFSGRDASFAGKIWKRDGVALPVVARHKVLADYFEGLVAAGFSSMPHVEELGVTNKLIDLDGDFFGPLQGYPLHILFQLQK